VNFLAHIYLSGSDPKVKLGNFIADSVKGNSCRSYPEDIRKGILMHREIDSFTDNHPITKQINSLLRPQAGRFAGIYSDIFYDHFLSICWDEYCNMPLPVFIERTYSEFIVYKTLCPQRTQKVLPSLIYNNWLGRYDSFYGLRLVLSKMASRTIMPDRSVETVQLLKHHYSEIEKLSKSFLAEVKMHLGELY